MVAHEYHRFYFRLDNTGSCPISITLIFLCLDNRGSCPISIKYFFWVLDCVVGAPSVSRQKYAWKILDPAPSVSHDFFCAWTIVDPAPSVSNIFFGCWIVWSVPHQYHDKNMLGQYWILPHQYHMIFFVLGLSWILPHQYQIFFLGVGLCGPCPISITTKICLDHTGSGPISIT